MQCTYLVFGARQTEDGLCRACALKAAGSGPAAGPHGRNAAPPAGPEVRSGSPGQRLTQRAWPSQEPWSVSAPGGRGSELWPVGRPFSCDAPARPAPRDEHTRSSRRSDPARSASLSGARPPWTGRHGGGNRRLGAGVRAHATEQLLLGKHAARLPLSGAEGRPERVGSAYGAARGSVCGSGNRGAALWASRPTGTAVSEGCSSSVKATRDLRCLGWQPECTGMRAEGAAAGLRGVAGWARGGRGLQPPRHGVAGRRVTSRLHRRRGRQSRKARAAARLTPPARPERWRPQARVLQPGRTAATQSPQRAPRCAAAHLAYPEGVAQPGALERLCPRRPNLASCGTAKTARPTRRATLTPKSVAARASSWQAWHTGLQPQVFTVTGYRPVAHAAHAAHVQSCTCARSHTMS